MAKAILTSLVIMVAGIAGAANVPSGITGLWRFQNSTNFGQATLGHDITFNITYGTQFLGPWTDIGTESLHTIYSDGFVFQEQQYNYMSVNPGFTANGGGTYVNQYTVTIDYVQTMDGWNSLFQTAFGGTDNDGDLWIDGTIRTNATIGVGPVGYSTLTFDASAWHRIVWSVDNGNFFRVYIDGTLFLDGTPQDVDGRFSLYPDRFNLFADDNGEDMWGLVGTVATWDRALTSEEVAGMGGWIGGAPTPTPLIFSETTTNATPLITSVSPADGETNASPNFVYQATVLDSSTATVDQNTVQLLLDGAPVTPTVNSALGNILIKYSAGGLLQAGSTHKYTLTFNTTGVPLSFTNEVTFKVQNYTSYEWRFTHGDLSTDLGNGVMEYADATTPGITSFGTTDGSTVPHINGSPAKYMHVPAFTDAFGGYYLSFNDTGPNAPTGAYVNRYTILFDVMIPGPLDWTPFFNADPLNSPGNDADFYVAPDGSLGITAIYSATNIVATNTWYRIAFVADLAKGTMAFYVNGAQVAAGTQPGSGVDGRWALYSNLDPGADLLLFNENFGDGNKYTHELYVSSVAFSDRALGSDELAALGGPSANGTLVGSFAPKPTLKIQASGGGATISWPSNYVGYALVQSDSLTAPAWKPVAGITNHAVNLAVSGTPRFFRLTQ